ncbi:MAG: trehalose-phosphatase [Planctomycetota bacterium]
MTDRHNASEQRPAEHRPAETLDEAIARVARSPVLLVATDYDGTLAPIVENPADARPHREAVIAVRTLAEIHKTEAAIISGRSLADLADLTGSPAGVHLVGSHGSEFDVGFADSLTPAQRRLLERVTEQLGDIASSAQGLAIETKPASTAFHYRNAAEAEADAAVSRVNAGPACLPGVHVRRGKKVIELAVVPTDKGRALATLRQRFGASAAVFLGDDRTDEDAFAAMSGPDVSVKVGVGETLATFRVDDTQDVSRILAKLSDHRAAWLRGEGAVPIEEHALLSDGRTVALVTPKARVTWMCAPRIDSPALFADLLGGDAAGHFTVHPLSGGEPKQAYDSNSLVLRTSWPDLSVTDYLDTSGGRATQRAGRTDLIRVLEGKGPVRIEFAPRLDFGRTATAFDVTDEGLSVSDTVDPIVLRAPGVNWELHREGQHVTATAEITLKAGEPLMLELRCGTGNLRPDSRDEAARRSETAHGWTKWADKLELPGLHTDLVRRSALTLRALAYGPTGAFSAAATTSLPETLGGVRNWDYRFCWPRDASMSALALVRLGSTQEAMRFLDWCLNIVDELPSPDRIRPIYSVTGGDLPPEAEITELAGYAGSRPVRVGNAASAQIQLDVIGPIIELIDELGERGAPISAEHMRLTESLLSAVEKRWHEPDHGIWEIRLARRHHVHSRAMCWLAADRGARIARRFTGRDKPEWAALAEEIKSDLLRNGVDPDTGAFTTAYGYPDPDASALLVGLTGMLDPMDERFVKTVELVDEQLREGPAVWRYRYDDGLAGREGGFLICTGWLIESLVLIGRVAAARALLTDLCALAGPTGLLPEQYDPAQSVALGNHPQAYSHLAVINASIRLDSGA